MLSKLLPTPRTAFVCILSLFATVSLAQKTIHVGPGQTYTTIQSGIDAANTGDTVLVAPGTYNENIDFKGKAITVTSSGGPSVTTINGANGLPAATFVHGETRDSVLSNFKITGGGDVAHGSFTAAVYIQDSSPTVLNNIITRATCQGIHSLDSGPLIQGNEISYVHDQANVCVFTGGTGILLEAQEGGTVAIVLANTIENNTESGLKSIYSEGGGGITILGATAVIQNNIIRNNATHTYSHLYEGGDGGGMLFAGSTTGLIADNLIYGNTADNTGGGISFVGGTAGETNIDVINNTIVDNSVVPTNSETSIGGQQVYIFGVQGNTYKLSNNVISGSTTGATVVCYINPGLGLGFSIAFRNNDLYNSTGPAIGIVSSEVGVPPGPCIDPAGTGGNISADPMFSSESSANYHPLLDSPVVDAGDNGAFELSVPYGVPFDTDLDGRPRVQDATGKGCIVDMGAYEYPGSLSECDLSETLTSSLNPAIAGQSVTFKAQLTAESVTPTGAIQFLDGANPLSKQTVSGSGSAAFSTNVLAVGSHTITANYQPTGTFGPSTASLTEVIKGYTTGANLTCLPNPIDIGNTARLTATVTSANGTPTGSISFTDNGASLATQSLAGGTASLTYTGSIAGMHNIIASYTPTGSFTSSSATCSEVVNTLPTTSTLTIAPTISTYGSPITVTATVSPATLPGPSTPTGVVTFLNGASAIGTGTLVGGTATLALNSLPGGTHTFTCMYSGSSIYSTSNCDPVPVIIHAAPTELFLSSSNNPYPALSPITFKVRLFVNGPGQSAGAGNVIRLSINGQTITLTTDAGGSATYTIDTLVPNSYPVTASFAATENLLASSASLTEVITAIPTSISLTGTPNPGNVNQPITLTAAVASQITSAQVGNNSGSVTFYDGSTSLGSSQLSTNGTAKMTTRFSSPGVHNLTAVYDGDADFSSSTSAVLKETIVAGDFSISVLPGAASVYTGESAPVKVSVTSLQGFQEPLALTCSGLPTNAACSFSPASLPDGQGAANLVIQTAAPHKTSYGSVSGAAAALGALTLFLLPGWRHRRGLLAGFSVVLLAVGIGMGIAGCGSPNPITGGTPPGTYQVSVTATTTGAGTALTHSAVVTLTVKSLF